VDEANMLVQSLTITPAREEKAFKGANRATQGLLYTNPTLTFAFKAIISDVSGLADQHPGTEVTELANFAGDIHGFDPDQGTLIYKDPSREEDNDNPDMVNFTIAHFPFVVNA
jgi:hypothetical protein